jgi:uncharacterized protein (TIGR00730 family)
VPPETRAPIEQVCVYCASSDHCPAVFLDEAFAVGQALAHAGKVLRYGGGDGGLMGRVADGALAAGGRVVGVLPRFMREREWAHLGLTELHLVDTMHERKALMLQDADACVAMPGGVGTFDELFEVVSWKKLGIWTGPIALLNTEGFWDPAVELLERAVQTRFAHERHRDLWVVVDRPDQLLDALESAPPWDSDAIDFARI